MGFQVYNSQGQELQNLTGTAGGDLTGTYPNPDIAAGKVGTAELASAVGNFGAWTDWTPQIDQGATTNIAKTVTYAKYCQIGKIVFAQARLLMTAAGTSGANITSTFPVAPASTGQFATFGSFTYLRSGFAVYAGSAVTGYAADKLNFLNDPSSSSTQTMGQNPVAFAIANNNVLAFDIVYEAA